MTFLDAEQTRELFMFHAFKHANRVTNDFKNIFMEIIKTCGGLQKLQTSIGQLNALQNLDLKHRSSLQELQTFIGQLKALQNLNLKHRSSLQEIQTSIG